MSTIGRGGHLGTSAAPTHLLPNRANYRSREILRQRFGVTMNPGRFPQGRFRPIRRLPRQTGKNRDAPPRPVSNPFKLLRRPQARRMEILPLPTDSDRLSPNDAAGLAISPFDTFLKRRRRAAIRGPSAVGTKLPVRPTSLAVM